MGSMNVEFHMMRLCLHKTFHRGLGPPGWMACALTTQGEGEAEGGNERIKARKSYFLAAPIMYSAMFIQAFFKLTKQFEEFIFIWGTWHFMSFIGGEENQYLQVGFF